MARFSVEHGADATAEEKDRRLRYSSTLLHRASEGVIRGSVFRRARHRNTNLYPDTNLEAQQNVKTLSRVNTFF